MSESDKCLDRFVGAVLLHKKYMELPNAKAANQQYQVLQDSLADLKKLTGGSLAPLKTLLSHSDANVRCCAASRLLWICEDEAIAVLREIVKNEGMIGGEAEIVINEWKQGNLKPP